MNPGFSKSSIVGAKCSILYHICCLKSFINVLLANHDLVSCMSHPTDRSLAVALQFNLDKYETENYPKVSKLRRAKRQFHEHHAQGKPAKSFFFCSAFLRDF